MKQSPIFKELMEISRFLLIVEGDIETNVELYGILTDPDEDMIRALDKALELWIRYWEIERECANDFTAGLSSEPMEDIEQEK